MAKVTEQAELRTVNDFVTRQQLSATPRHFHRYSRLLPDCGCFMGDIVRNIIKLVRDALTPDPQRRDVLPVLSAIAEGLMPSRPEKAAEARRQGQVNLAVFHESSGKQQPSHLKEVLQLVEIFCRRLCSTALTLIFRDRS